MKPNILLVIVDALRYDYALKMPFLRQLGQALPGGYWFENHWATSHCTDPCVMHMLTGKHPDELRLYSMMFDNKSYTIPNVKTFFDVANDYEYHTAFITNLQRWYSRGVKEFIDSRGKGIDYPWDQANRLVRESSKPWLVVLHTDDCHTRYTGGTYAEACGFTDRMLKQLYSNLPRNTVMMVTSDHGEGLGESGPDGKPIEQHGYGLWDFLTHIPLVISYKSGRSPFGVDPSVQLTDHGYTHDFVRWTISDKSNDHGPYYLRVVFQAGATTDVFHRGVVDEFGRQFIRAIYPGNKYQTYCLPEGDVTAALEVDLKNHCEKHGIKYGEISEEAALIERLEGLGYWKE